MQGQVCKVAVALIVSLSIVRPTQADEPKIVRPGVPAVQTGISKLKPAETFNLGGTPDWMALTDDAVWVSNAKLKVIQRIDPQANKVVATIAMRDTPCSGLAVGVNSLWVPLCGKPPSVVRIDLVSNKVVGTVPVGPADSEGGIAASPDSIWIITDKNGALDRIDQKSYAVTAHVMLPSGSLNPLYAEGLIWITGFESNRLIVVDPANNRISASIPTGPHPRFLTSGAGSVWTLNQGDGSITRVDGKSRTAITSIEAGVPGFGGEIAFGAGFVWTTVFDIPLTRIDATENKVTRQWIGPGGDSVRYGFDSVWLTDYNHGLLWRIPSAQVTQ